MFRSPTVDPVAELGVEKLLLFDDNKVKMARMRRKKQKENPVGCIGEGKDEKEIREGTEKI